MSILQKISMVILAVAVVTGGGVATASAEPPPVPMQSGQRHKRTATFSDMNACHVWRVGMLAKLSVRGNVIARSRCFTIAGQSVIYGEVYYYGAK